MAMYFGDSIFQCMVVVATRDQSIYDFIPEGTNLYKEEHFEKTRSIFEEAMKLALGKKLSYNHQLYFCFLGNL